MPRTPSIARIALDVPIDTLFDYACGTPSPAPGSLVEVPFGRRRAVGVVVECQERSEVAADRVKPVERVLEVAPLPAQTLALARFCADYYRYPLGPTLATILPTMLRRPGRGSRPRLWGYRLTALGRSQSAAAVPARAAGARRLLALLTTHELVDTVQARLVYRDATRLLKQWLDQGWVTREPIDPSAPTQGVSPAPPLPVAPLTPEQEEVVRSIDLRTPGYRASLLQGVTGSGKTEVYQALIAEAAAAGGQTLLLVPEINLTPQLEARFAARLPELGIVSLHSGLAEGERLRRWERARAGAADIVLGTRLAVFTPLPRLALVVVDEEHDPSFKQQEGLRYHARDMAIYLARQHQVPIVLGSATPSLESYANALAGRYGHLHLRARPRAAAPLVRTVDVRGMPLEQGLSSELLSAIDARLGRGEQSLVFINRRGYAPVLFCSACGWMAECGRCAARLTLHLKAQRLRCHYCGHQERIASRCPSCGNQDLHGVGQGTQRVEEALVARFPAARVLRVDSDSTRRRGAFADMRERIHAGAVDLLVGTQMLGKGHDFPRLTLVGVVGADHGLFSSDFRATERLFQQLMQVAGRAGRAELAGEVVVQTEFPTHPLYAALADQDFDRFARLLLAERRHAEFPPYAYQALLRAQAHDQRDVDQFLAIAARDAHAHADGVEVYDPVPAPVARIAGHWRGQLLVQARSRPALKRFLAAWHPLLTRRKAPRVRWFLDVDPVEL